MIDRAQRTIERAASTVMPIAGRRRHCTLGVVAFELDGFRLFRESCGPALADAIIKRAATILQTTSCPSTIARHGTDGFIVVLDGLACVADVAACVQQWLEMIAMPQDLGGTRVQVTASAGVAVFPKDGEDLDTLSRSAQQALRKSKAGSPGNMRFYSGNVAFIAKRNMRLEMDLRRAIEYDGLTRYYQAQYDLQTGRACGVEVLARWFRADRTTVPPHVFVPLAERADLIHALGSWVLRGACADVRAWRTPASEPLLLCVNVSPKQIDAEFPELVQRILQSTGFPANQLELEITESALMGDADFIVECFKQLKLIGVRIAIDDFGIGYSSLGYLSRLPVDRLKLDKSLIRNLTTRWKDVAIVRAIIGLGRELGLAVIAEGVESEQQFRVLEDVGCPEVQGYLLARPAPQSEAAGMLGTPWGARHPPPSIESYTVMESVDAC